MRWNAIPVHAVVHRHKATRKMGKKGNAENMEENQFKESNQLSVVLRSLQKHQIKC